MKFLLYSLLIFNFGCANYVNQLHRQIDSKKQPTNAPIKNNLETSEKKNPNQIRSPFEDPFYYASYYKGKPIKLKNDLRPINAPKSVGAAGASNTPEYKKRHKAGDFKDNGNNASLWSGKGKSRYLFSDIKSKEIGDIIIINVFESLKNRISNELKRNFGSAPKKAVVAVKPAADDKATTGKKEEPKKEVAKVEEDKDLEATNKIYDKISGLIVEEVNQDYLLVKGKKEVIFQKRNHEVGVQALISRDDINQNNEIPSDKMLETQVLILR